MKYLILLVTLFYLFYKVTSFFFRAGAASQRQQKFDKGRETGVKEKKPGAVKGGEYVDYEEVK